MVAITVILAAVIGTFVLGLGSGTQANPSAGVTTSQSDGGGANAVTVRITSIDNADKIEYRVTDNSGDGSDAGTGSWTEIGSSDVGDSVTIGNSGSSGLEETDDVTIRATYKGKTTVLTTYTVK
jgi:FlaG/FlaF family flagellin (archaellin)